jgi:hypothetical protein
MIKRIPKPLPIAEIVSSTKKSKDVLDKLADLNEALNHGLHTLSVEVKKLRIKSHQTKIPLSEREMKVLIDAVKALLSAERQQLEAARAAEMSKRVNEMTDAELLEYAKSIISIPAPETEDPK